MTDEFCGGGSRQTLQTLQPIPKRQHIVKRKYKLPPKYNIVTCKKLMWR